MTARSRIGVMISGRGSNMIALAEACRARDFPAEIAVVFANDEDAPGLVAASEMGLAVAALSHRGYRGGREAHERAVDEILRAHGVELVCLAGYMRLLTPWFVGRWRDRLLNIHPSLLPAYRGLETHARALADGVRWHGCTVHLVRAELDDGPIVAQAAVPVAPDDTAEALAERVLRAEHRLYAHAVRLFAAGQVRVEGERVVSGAFDLPPTQFNPPLDDP